MTTTPTRRRNYYEEIRQKGYSRTIIGAYMGLEATGVAQVANALQKSTRVPVIWLRFQDGMAPFSRTYS